MKMEEMSSLKRVFGSSPMVKVIDFLLAESDLYDYTLSDISENSGVSWSSLHRIFPKLVEMGIVEQTRMIANAKLYHLNEKNHLAQELIRIDAKISDYFIEKELETQKEDLVKPVPA